MGEFFDSFKPVDLGKRPADCEKHGAFESTGFSLRRMSKWSTCPECERDERARRELFAAEAKAERIQRERVEAIRGAGIALRFEDRSFASYVAETDGQRHALTVARDFVEDFPANLRRGSGLVFAGTPGTGKNHLAAAIVIELCQRYFVGSITATALIRRVRDSWRKDSDVSEKSVMRELGSTLDLLVIDEIGAQNGTENEQHILFEVIDNRYSGKRPTILMSNQSIKGIAGYIGERAFDRLKETSTLVKFDWPSYRPIARSEQ